MPTLDSDEDTGYYDDFTSPEDMAKYAEVLEKQKNVDAVKEKEANMSLKAKTRERVQPKMGKIDIDYQKLHDAFFKFQTKPPVTGFGEMCVVFCALEYHF